MERHLERPLKRELEMARRGAGESTRGDSSWEPTGLVEKPQAGEQEAVLLEEEVLKGVL